LESTKLYFTSSILTPHIGTFEKGDREYTFDEMYCVDIGKLDGVKQIFRREPENWLGSDDEESDDEENSEDEDDDEEDDSEGDKAMTDAKPLYTESKRKGKGKGITEMAGVESSEVISSDASTASSVFDDTPDDITSTATEDDNLPHPRPFESRRDFFQRTGNEWQEALMTGLRWKGVQPESLSVKEIKTRAFEMSEEKWWDCREEITALEDEQEAAGIGEVVTLADRGETTGGVGRRR
jgi:hypothetical protein